MSKESLDANCARGQRKQSRTFENSPDGWKLILAWFTAMGSKKAHVCMEATGRHSLGVALALHDAGHIVSIVNPAQIRDFARTKLGRNKTDKIDAVLIREYAGLFKPGPWAPPSSAMRRLCELQTVRTGIVNNRAEWKNRIGSGLGDSIAISLAAATIEHLTAQIEAVDKAIRETIDQDDELRGKRNLLLSVVGATANTAGRPLSTLHRPSASRGCAEKLSRPVGQSQPLQQRAFCPELERVQNATVSEFLLTPRYNIPSFGAFHAADTR